MSKIEAFHRWRISELKQQLENASKEVRKTQIEFISAERRYARLLEELDQLINEEKSLGY